MAEGRRILDEEPRSTAELGALLAERWPDHDPTSLGYAMRNLVPLVQVPPRGIWGAGGRPILATAEHWLGREMSGVSAPDEMVLRYLGAFGPATVADAQAWSGLSRLREVFERLRPDLRTFRDEDGRELFDLADGSLPDPDSPAPVRFLPDFDNALLAHADRRRIIPDDFARPPSLVIGQRSVLVDGFVRGTWRLERRSAAATLRITLARDVSGPDRDEVEEEGRHLLGFLAAEAASAEVVLAP